MTIYATKNLALFPGLHGFFVLRFAFSIIHGGGRALCIILNANRRTKNGVGLGTRLQKTYRQYNFKIMNLMSQMCVSIWTVCGGHGTLYVHVQMAET